MAITSTEAIKFSNEQVRPLSEKMRNLYYELKSMVADWNNGDSANFPVDDQDMLEDGREVNGVSRLSGNDVNLFISQAQAYIAQIEGAGVLNVVSKPCVRPFRGE